jgi:hypothetical protein
VILSLVWANCLALKGMTAAHKAKSQWLRAALSGRTSPPTSGGKFTSSKAQFFPELKSTRGRGSWGPYGRSQSTGLQAVLRFPPASQLLLLAADPPAPLPVGFSFNIA